MFSRGLDRNRYGLFEVFAADGESPWLKVIFSALGGSDNDKYSQAVSLEVQRLHLGGKRFWFRCPGCNRRTGFLYLPPEADYFACRLCHGLTYRSSQLSPPIDINASLQRFHEQLDKMMGRSSKGSNAAKETPP